MDTPSRPGWQASRVVAQPSSVVQRMLCFEWYCAAVSGLLSVAWRSSGLLLAPLFHGSAVV
eukprot:4284593-Alexandrium_andersonii.AAC.1